MCAQTFGRLAGGEEPVGRLAFVQQPDRASIRAAAVKYSECMRSHGVTNFPDPDGPVLASPTITAERAAARLTTGELVVVDIRQPAELRASRVRDAVNIP
jgi:hypothetical protein